MNFKTIKEYDMATIVSLQTKIDNEITDKIK